MIVDLTKLPKEILDQIPLSIRTFRTVYELHELPVRIQHLIQNYISSIPDIEYSVLFDFVPESSTFGDFRKIDNVVDLTVEYLKNYLLITPGTYPFDPEFGCTLKYHLQTKDTHIRQTLISAEINRVADVIRTLLKVNLVINSVEITPVSVGAAHEYDVYIHLTINEVRKKIKYEFR